MKKTLCAGAVALAAIGLFSHIPALSAAELSYTGMEQPGLLAEINIGRIRNVLQLKPEQVVYWPPVEAALRDVARQQAHNEPVGFVRRISRRVVSIVLTSAAVERLALAARPLIAVLSDDQKRAVSGLAQEMGLGPVLAALN
jgi:hypothetical protein